MSAQQTENNGVNVKALAQYVEAVKDNRELARVRFKATSRWQGGCRTEVALSEIHAAGKNIAPATRTHILHVDEPEPLGGHDSAPNPVEYIAAGLCGCLTAGVATNAALFETELDSIEVEVDVDFDVIGLLGLDRSTSTGAQRIHYTVRLKGPGAREALERAKATIDRKSPIANTLAGAIEVTTDLVVNS